MNVKKRTRHVPKKGFTFVSKRSFNRRRLRGETLRLQYGEKFIRLVLAHEGKTWRYYEKATRDETRRIIELAVAIVKSLQPIKGEPLEATA